MFGGIGREWNKGEHENERLPITILGGLGRVIGSCLMRQRNRLLALDVRLCSADTFGPTSSTLSAVPCARWFRSDICKPHSGNRCTVMLE